MAVALLLYVLDAGRLLKTNQAVLLHDQGDWRVAFGSRTWTIAGHEPYLPNLLKPYQPCYILQWQLRGTTPTVLPAHPLEAQQLFTRFIPFVVIAELCLFVLLPLGLFTRAGSLLTLASAILVSLSTLFAMALVFKHRNELGIDPGRIMVLAIECLACPPFALNLIRKLCAMQNVDEDFEHAAARVLLPAELQRAHLECLRRLDDVISAIEERSPEESELLSARARFLAAGQAHESH